jgi:hypothetical protein
MSELVGNISNNIMKKNKKNLYFSWVFFNITKHLIIKTKSRSNFNISQVDFSFSFLEALLKKVEIPTYQWRCYWFIWAFNPIIISVRFFVNFLW